MKKRKLSVKKTIVFIIFICSVCLLIISGYKLVMKMIDEKKINSQLEKLNISSIVNEVNSDNAQIIKQSDVVDGKDPYWGYIKMPFISVDFSELLEINNDTRGWIKVNGTNINYPIVQASDNSFYLNHAFDKSYNSAGWVFMDYRNNASVFDKNTIIYAHGMYNGTMFGSLKNIVNSNWYSNSDNYIVKLSTVDENTLWQVFSVYHIKTTSDYLKTDFKDNKSYQKFLDMLMKRSIYDFNTSVNSNDKIVTLSTCFDKKEKVVMHAKLIKKEAR